MTKNIIKLSFVGILGIMTVCAADAAPAIKKLGGSTASAIASSSSSSVEGITPSRAAAVRVAKPSVSAKASGVNSAATTSRLSLGKYLHNSSLVKQNTSSGTSVVSNSGTTNVGGGSSSAGLSSSEAIVLQDRVTTNENNIATLQEDVEVLRNDKQDVLTAGNGIVIENGEISAKIPVGSATAEPTAIMWVE